MNGEVYSVEIDCSKFMKSINFKEFNYDRFNPLRDFMGDDNYLKLSEREKEKGRKMTLRVKY